MIPSLSLNIGERLSVCFLYCARRRTKRPVLEKTAKALNLSLWKQFKM